MSASFGQRWHLSQLTPTAKQKYTDAVKYERSHLSLKFTSFHPIYFLDLPDLRELISRKDNWRQVFSTVFGEKDYEKVKTTLSELEPIRNSVAHNRPISEADANLVRGIREKFKNWIGARFDTYRANAHAYRAIFGHFSELATEIETLYRSLSSAKVVDEPCVWNDVHSKWWFEPSYLSDDISDIEDFYSMISGYRSLRRGRGRGIAVEAWLNNVDHHNLFKKAVLACNRLLETGQREETE
jgi:hypothetical protein